MTGNTDENTALLQNLKDAGCDSDMIDCCMNTAQQYSAVRMLPLLQAYRNQLLDTIHDGQDKLECLDYLIFRLKKQK